MTDRYDDPTDLGLSGDFDPENPPPRDDRVQLSPRAKELLAEARRKLGKAPKEDYRDAT